MTRQPKSRGITRFTVGGEGFPPPFSGASPTFRLSGHNQLTYIK